MPPENLLTYNDSLLANRLLLLSVWIWAYLLRRTYTTPHGPKQAQTRVNDETLSRRRPVPILPKQTIKAIWGSLQSGKTKKAALSTPTLLPCYTVTVAAGTH